MFENNNELIYRYLANRIIEDYNLFSEVFTKKNKRTIGEI